MPFAHRALPFCYQLSLPRVPNGMLFSFYSIGLKFTLVTGERISLGIYELQGTMVEFFYVYSGR